MLGFIERALLGQEITIDFAAAVNHYLEGTEPHLLEGISKTQQLETLWRNPLVCRCAKQVDRLMHICEGTTVCMDENQHKLIKDTFYFASFLYASLYVLRAIADGITSPNAHEWRRLESIKLDIRHYKHTNDEMVIPKLVHHGDLFRLCQAAHAGWRVPVLHDIAIVKRHVSSLDNGDHLSKQFRRVIGAIDFIKGRLRKKITDSEKMKFHKELIMLNAELASLKYELYDKILSSRAGLDFIEELYEKDLEKTFAKRFHLAFCTLDDFDAEEQAIIFIIVKAVFDAAEQAVQMPELLAN